MSMTTRGMAVGMALLISSTLSAQAPNAPPPRLVNAKTLKCSFTTMSTGTWKDGVGLTATKPATMAIQFNAVDTQDGTAEAVGDSGKAHITVRVAGSYLHLMAIDPYGALHVTTVFNQTGTGGKYLAAHSRHEFTPVQLPGLTSRPEQYVGDCVVTP